MELFEPVITRIGINQNAEAYRYLAIFEEKQVRCAKIFINHHPGKNEEADQYSRVKTSAIPPFTKAVFELPIRLDSEASHQYQSYGILGAQTPDQLQKVDMNTLQEENVFCHRVIKEAGVEHIGLATCNGGGYSDEVPDSVKHFLWGKMQDNHLNFEDGTDPQQLELLVLAGDQIYADPLKKDYADGSVHRENLLQSYRKRYVDVWSQSEIKSVLARVPTIMMWNDHDIFNGYGSYTDNEDQNIRDNLFDAASKSFDDFQGSVNPDPIHSGVARAFSLKAGNAAFLVTDARTNRNYNEGRILGIEQIKAIIQETELIIDEDNENISVPEHLFIVVGIPFYHFGRQILQDFHKKLKETKLDESWLGKFAMPKLEELETDYRDGWVSDRNKKEFHLLMKRLLDALKGYDGKVTVLSGDVHLSTVAKIIPADYDSKVALNQVTSSPIGYAPQKILDSVGEWITNINDEIKFKKRKIEVSSVDENKNFSLAPFKLECELQSIGEEKDDILASRNYATLHLGTDNSITVNYHYEKNMKNGSGKNKMEKLPIEV